MSVHFTSTIEFQISLLLFVAIVGYLIATRINQSPVIGQILAGILIGPSLLNLITYTDFIRSMAQLGAVILLFVIGLEFKLKDIFNVRYTAIALVGVIVPWIGGFLTGKAFGYSFDNAVFIGTALTATSIAITANVLKEMNKLKTEAAKAIMGAAIIDDVLALLALSLSKQVVNGTFSLAAAIVPIIKALLFLVVGIYLGQNFFRRLIERADETVALQKYPEFVFIFTMAFAFVYAMAAELLNLSAIVGAFLAGISLEGAVICNSKNYKEGAEYLRIIFASIFFVSLGVLVDVRAVTQAVIWFVIALTVVAVLTKVIGCFVPAKLQGMSTKDAAIVGVGMSPRGEVAMIVGLIGLNQGIIHQEIYAAIILMSIITTILTPIILQNWLYK